MTLSWVQCSSSDAGNTSPAPPPTPLPLTQSVFFLSTTLSQSVCLEAHVSGFMSSCDIEATTASHRLPPSQKGQLCPIWFESGKKMLAPNGLTRSFCGGPAGLSGHSVRWLATLASSRVDSIPSSAVQGLESKLRCPPGGWLVPTYATFSARF